MNPTRILTVAVLLAVLLTALWLLRGTILEEMSRCPPWQRIAYWVGDVFAVFFAIRWAFSSNQMADTKHSPQPDDARRSIALKVTLAVVLSLLVDISFTAFTAYTKAEAMREMIPAKAEVVDFKKVNFNGKADHYSVQVRFADQAKVVHDGVVTFSSKHAEGPEDWMVQPLAILEDPNQKAKVIDVGYDPNWPKRVWALDQSFGSTSGLNPLFSIIHIWQLIMLGYCFDYLRPGARADNSWLAMMPLACEAVMLLIFGLFLV